MHYIICIYLFICFKFLTNFYHFPFLIIIQLIFGSWNEGQILFILNLSISKISYFALGCIHRLRIVQKFFLLPILSLFSPPFFVFAKLLTSKPFRRLRFLSRQNSLPPCKDCEFALMTARGKRPSLPPEENALCIISRFASSSRETRCEWKRKIPMVFGVLLECTSKRPKLSRSFREFGAKTAYIFSWNFRWNKFRSNYVFNLIFKLLVSYPRLKIRFNFVNWNLLLFLPFLFFDEFNRWRNAKYKNFRFFETLFQNLNCSFSRNVIFFSTNYKWNKGKREIGKSTKKKEGRKLKIN